MPGRLAPNLENCSLAELEVAAKAAPSRRSHNRLMAIRALTLNIPAGQMKLLKKHEASLAELFIVSKVTLGEGTGEDIRVLVKRAGGAKCERCWNWSDSVGKNAGHPVLCARCSDVVGSMGR